ncbi:heavy metal translocating P-type ATPase [Bacillus sp. FJAT-45350]|uniref:heavy metal translocating P-type ATPase n=1 Tax=Bacillus sp. FJAT-45350 TaxID=2011014 RepID=UPI00211C4081|nr:heavy metal translocating P-type ATPase [Bacillus sp. FJAT-45350]
MVLSSWGNKLLENRQLTLALISGVFLGVASFIDYRGLTEAAITLYILAYLSGGFYKTREGLKELFKERKLSVEVLMIIAAIGAAIIGYWAEGAILIFIFAMSGALETYTLNRSHKAISSLMELQPEEVTLLVEGKEKKVAIEDLQLGDAMLVKAGERIGADGEILSGETTIDEAAITGESMPISKHTGDEVFAGTVNLNGSITVTVTKKSNETLFQKIITLVQSAKEDASPSQQWIERFEGPYVKIVLLFVALMIILPPYLFSWSWEESFYRGMVLLVVASPCALVASVMPATLSAISNGARSGILFKGGVYLEELGSVKAIALDKTGTITNGKPEVTDVYIRENEEERFYQIVTSIENESNHPLAQAIVRYGKQQSSLNLIKPEQVTDVSGWGVEALIDNEHWKIGKRDFMKEDEVTSFYDEIGSILSGEGKTVVYVEDSKGLIGVLALEDTVRDTAIEAIQQMKKNGIYTVMITGDHEKTATVISNKTKLDTFRANCLPDKKVEEIKLLKEKYKHVAMVGDGINDAPALATANVGIAMGAGTDIAIESSNVVLMKNDLSKLTKAMQLSRRLNRIIKQNIIFSIAVIIVLIASNFFQYLSLPLGVIGHEGSTLLVILNGLRLLRN